MVVQISRHSLSVPGASLEYEIRFRKSGAPFLLLIPGCTGIKIFAALANQLAFRFTVVSYDRRGYAGSVQDTPPLPEENLKINGDDAAALIQHLSGSEPIIVFGTSGGAMASFELLRRHGSLVRTLILHEPPVMSVLPDPEKQDWENTLDTIKAAYENGGIAEASGIFGTSFLNSEDAQAMAQSMTSEASLHDTDYFYRHEIDQVRIYKLDCEILAKNKEKLIFTGGQQSKNYKPYRPLQVISQRVGLEIVDLPGGHVGYAASNTAAAFALELHNLIETHPETYLAVPV